MRKRLTAFCKRTLKTAIFAALFIVAISAISMLNQNSTSKSSNPLINIKELPESFMEKYLSDYAEIKDNNAKSNILIVTSAEEPTNTYGAKNVIYAANNQYFLEYESSEAKDLAYEQMKSLPNLSVAKNALRTFSGDGDDDAYNSWGIEKMGLAHVKELLDGYQNKNDVVVAILDTGLDVNLFKENFDESKLAGTFNVQANTEKVTDEVGHGTHIAGTIAEGTPDNVKILSIKMSSTREIYSTDIIAAIDYVTYYTDADVMNMSFGGYNYEDGEYLAVEAAKENNIISVAAAGNESTSERSFPSSFDNTISISAVDSNYGFAEFSNFGPMVDFAAPGVDILSINGNMSGTSMATPHAVAAVAIARSFKKDITFEDTISFLKTRAIDLGAKGKDGRFGWGFVDFNGATLCTNTSQSCDQYSIFEIEQQVGIEITEPILTKYNYGSLTNILATKVKFKYASGYEKEKVLGDLGTDAIITGYDPYATGEQEVTVKYEDFTATFTVENPTNWENGWLSYTYDSRGIISEYRDNGLKIKTLYLPEQIDGQTIKGTNGGCMFNGNSEAISICEYPDSEDARYFETLVIPATIEKISGFYGYYESDRLQNLHTIIHLGNELELSNNAFSNLKNLVRVDANVNFYKGNYGDSNGNTWTKYDSSAFYDDISLESVRIADGVEAIPESTFANCKSLETINLPASIQTIERNAFAESGIRYIEFGDNVKTIEENAFYKSQIEELHVPASLTDISNTAFIGTSHLGSIEVDAANPVYDSRDSSNAVIVTADNKILIGSYNTEIPASVKIIGENSFRDNGSLFEIVIPEGVETIEQNAFAEGFYLTKVTLPKSLTSMDDMSFYGSGMGMPSRTVFMVWNNSYAKNRVEELKYPYVLLDGLEEEPPLIGDATFEVIPEGYQFKAFEKVTPENFIIKVFYYDEETDSLYEEPEVITDYEVLYNNGQMDSLGGGYNNISFTFDTEKGYQDIKIDMMLFAEFLVPEYEIPTNISSYSGQALSEIELPQGFVWLDGDEFVDESKTEYLANFIPEDQMHYRIVEKIAIPITIKSATTFPEMFPDEALRACIVDTINQQESADYTDETIDLEKVLALTELDCSYTDGNEKITNPRGIEKLTNLKDLNLSNNAINKINLSNNGELESLDLRGNPIPKLNIEDNTKLNKFLIDGTGLGGEMTNVKAATYAQVEYEDETNESGHLIMDLSKLEFLKDRTFTIDVVTETVGEKWTVTYDENTGIARFDGNAMLRNVRITVRLENGDMATFVINAQPRTFYFTTYFDGKLLEQDAGFMMSYTNAKINMKDLASEVANFYGMPGYVLEEYTIANDDNYVVGTSDVYVTFRYVKIAGDEPDPGTTPEPQPDPGTPTGDGTDPDGSGTDGEDNIGDNPQTFDGIVPIMAVFIVLALPVVFTVTSRRLARRRNS